MDQNGHSILSIEDNRALAQMVKLKAKENRGETWKQFDYVPCDITKYDHIKYEESPLKHIRQVCEL
jgi:hypothetical protein